MISDGEGRAILSLRRCLFAVAVEIDCLVVRARFKKRRESTREVCWLLDGWLDGWEDGMCVEGGYEAAGKGIQYLGCVRGRERERTNGWRQSISTPT